MGLRFKKKERNEVTTQAKGKKDEVPTQKTVGFRVKNQYDTAEKFAWKCR